MVYQTTITKKGQITIPKEIREKLRLDPSQKVILDFDQELKIKPSESFREIAKRLKTKNKADVLKAREYFEKHYERV